MSYTRVVPRDLFNDANLLKCLGQLYLNIDNVPKQGFELSDLDGVDGFPIEQDEADGSTFCPLVTAMVNGEEFHFVRPMNSREPWPLLMRSQTNFDYDEIPVFTNNGGFHPDFLKLIAGNEDAVEGEPEGEPEDVQENLMRSFMDIVAR
jgi:hypothetical protein